MLGDKSLKSILASQNLVASFKTNYANKGLDLIGAGQLEKTQQGDDNHILFSSYVLKGTDCTISCLTDPEPTYRFECQGQSVDLTLWTLLAQAKPSKLDDAGAYLRDWLDEAVQVLLDEPNKFFHGARTITRHIQGYNPETNIFRRMSLAAGKEMTMHNIRPEERDDLDAKMKEVEPRFSDNRINKWIFRYLGNNIADLVKIGKFENFYVMPATEIDIPSVENVEVSKGVFEERTVKKKIRVSVPIVHYFGGSNFVDEFKAEIQKNLDFLIMESAREKASSHPDGYSDMLHLHIMEWMHSDPNYLIGLRPETLDPKQQAVRNALVAVYQAHVEDMGIVELYTKRGTHIPEANAKHIVEYIFTPGKNVLDTADIVLVEDITKYCIRQAFKKGLHPSITENSVRANGLEVVYVGKFAPKNHQRYVNAWLQSDEGVTYLESDHGKAWFENPDSLWWRMTPAGEVYAERVAGDLHKIFEELAKGDLDFKLAGELQTAVKTPETE